MKPHAQPQPQSSSSLSSSSTQKQQTTYNKLQKQIDNTNRQIVKCYQHHHSALLRIQALLGLGNEGQQLEEQGQQQLQMLQGYGLYKSKNNNSNINKSKRTIKKPFQSFQNSQASHLLSLNQQQILYYSCKYFIIYNITNKQYQIINKDIKNCTLKMFKKFNTTDNDNKLIVCVYRGNWQQESTFLALLTIKTDYESRTTRGEGRYSWRVVRLSTQFIHVQDYTYFAKKNFLYLVVNKQNTQQKYIANNNFFTESNNKDYQSTKNTTQFLYIYDLTKQIFQLNQQIRSNTVGFFVQFVCLQDSDKVYLCGRNYFRQWVVNFNEKSMKESNVRNIQRVLKGKQVVDVQEIDRYGMKLESDNNINITINGINNNNSIQQPSIPTLNPHLQPTSPILTHPSKLLIILTQQQILLIKQNQLISSFTPQQNISKQSKSKDNIQKQLENSFNQIHKMKFLFDQYQEMREREDLWKMNNFNDSNGDNIMQRSKNKEEVRYFTAMSKSWRTQNQNYFIAIANSKYALLIYQLVDYQFKLYTEIDYLHKDNINLTLRNIVPTQCGDILLCVNDMSQVHLVNQQNMENENNQSLTKSLWGNGHLHHGQIYGITSPMIQNIMCTVGEDETFKLWSMKNNQRSIVFECKSPGSRPLGITMHPNGTMVCVNFEREIRLYAILPHQFYEITNIKTNYCPIQLKYSDRGQFLVSNQGSVLIFYQSFSLKTLGYIQPADVQFKIVDFKISKNAGYMCFLTEDNACFLQSIDIGDLSQWDHFSPVHRQVQPYTAFYFDFIQKDKNVSDEKKVRNLFIGATRNKYMILYESLGSKLLAQFPIVDCYIVDIEIYQNLMFAATSKGTIRVYNWPILQQQLQLQIINAQTNQIRYKPPKYEQYQIWHESIPIMQIHKLNFTSQIIITNSAGNIAIFSFQQTKNKKIIYQQISPQRKKMQQLINQMFYIKKSEIEKRNKLIEKTQNDILKVENEILREKISLERKMQDEESGVRKGYEMKGNVQVTEKQEYVQKEEDEIALLRREIVNKQNALQQLKQFITNDYQQKKIYQQSRNDKVAEQIKQVILQHKQKIKRKIQTHKEDIRNKKKEYFVKVKQIQQQFDKEVVAVYEERLREMNVKGDEEIEKDDGQGRLEFTVGGFGNNKTKGFLKQGQQTNKERKNSSDFIMNLLAENVLTISNSTQQTDNENIKGLIDKLEGIQKQQYQTNSCVQNNVTINEQNINYGGFKNLLPVNGYVGGNNTKSSLNLNTQNSFKTFTNLQQQQQKQKQQQQKQKQQKQPTISKLQKRSVKYQTNQKAFLKKKHQQLQQQKIQQLQQKLIKSHQLMQKQFNDQIIQEMTSKQNQDIVIQSMRVQELQRSNLQLEKQILLLKMKVTEMESEDVVLQKDFQAHLEEYNMARFKNLNLHCEVLKMQNQLVERKQVLDNKQEIVMLAYQQKQKLQNYKQMVKGSLTKLQQNKQMLRQMFYKKQTDLNIIFSELINAIHKMQTKKDNLLKLQRKMKQAQKQQESKEKQLNEVVGKLKEVKKYLLLEKMTDQKSQKSIFQYEESLIQTINFLKKRLFMQSIKQKKNKQLKKSTLNQVLKQNKNLLQECNQLRSQGIEYENEIRNLSSKLREANKMISIETKLKGQKHDVNEQKNQLEIMKRLFRIQLEEFEGKDGGGIEEEESGREGQQQQEVEGFGNEENRDGYGNVREVYFDADKQKRQQKQQKQNQKQIYTKKYTKVDTKINNLLGMKQYQLSEQKDQQQNDNQHKPFKLSKYISAQPYEKI